jgi:hypothetical protein
MLKNLDRWRNGKWCEGTICDLRSANFCRGSRIWQQSWSPRHSVNKRPPVNARQSIIWLPQNQEMKGQTMSYTRLVMRPVTLSVFSGVIAWCSRRILWNTLSWLSQNIIGEKFERDDRVSQNLMIKSWSVDRSDWFRFETFENPDIVLFKRDWGTSNILFLAKDLEPDRAYFVSKSRLPDEYSCFFTSPSIVTWFNRRPSWQRINVTYSAYEFQIILWLNRKNGRNVYERNIVRIDSKSITHNLMYALFGKNIPDRSCHSLTGIATCEPVIYKEEFWI